MLKFDWNTKSSYLTCDGCGYPFSEGVSTYTVEKEYDNGFIEDEYTKLPDFSEQHAVSEEESTIFDTAVGDYPLIKAKATTVASRTIPGGTEYFFTAANLPREGAAPDEPTGEIKVYVTVLEGQAPEFTQVLI